MNTDYDVIVLGGGAPGEHCAAALAAGGVRVAIVERDLLGGECSYWAASRRKPYSVPVRRWRPRATCQARGRR